MYIQQIYTNCLAQAAYYIESNGVAAIVDPLRDVDTYLELAKSRNANIKYVLETHFHADFVSGHLDIARETGATIVFGASAQPAFHAFVAEDRTMLTLGDCKIEVIHTPGHTLESACFLLYDEQGKAHALFSGDTLFIGDVGRPDLLSGNLPADVLAEKLFYSLRDKILPLADDILLYPGHGAGSPCGKNLSKDTVCTIGKQKESNYALLEKDKAKFIQAVTTDQPLPPSYFFSDAMINKTGYELASEIVQKEMQNLSADSFAECMQEYTLVLDVRPADAFVEKHVAGSLNVGLDGMFAVWAGTFVSVKAPILIISESGKAKEAITRLLRVGFENVVGYFDGEITELESANIKMNYYQNLESKDFSNFVQGKDIQILDVRNYSELNVGSLENSINIPLNELHKRFAELDAQKPTLVYCAGGYRSVIAASILEQNGFMKIINLKKGFGDYAKTFSAMEMA